MSDGRPLTVDEVVTVYSAVRVCLPGTPDRTALTASFLEWASRGDTDLRLRVLALLGEHRTMASNSANLTRRRDEVYDEIRNLTQSHVSGGKKRSGKPARS